MREAWRKRWTACAAVAAVASWAWIATDATDAAGQAASHPAPPTARPIHLRLAEADAVVILSVTRVDRGRIAALRLETLFGDVPEHFEIKRSPLRPPPLAAHDRALVFLRGARPPYVLVDEPRETIRLASDAASAIWAEAVRGVIEHRGDPLALASLYAEWLDQGPETLRDLAFQGLVDPSLDGPEVREHLAAGRARVAGDPARPTRVRHLSALLAGRTDSGARALLRVALIEPVNPGVLSMALRSGVAHGSPGTAATFEAALARPEPGTRLSAVQAMVGANGELAASLRPSLTRVAQTDPDAGVREVASRVLGQRRGSRE